MNSNTLDDVLLDIAPKYGKAELEEIKEFLLPFSTAGQIYSVRIFERAALMKQRWEFDKLMSLFKGCFLIWNLNPERIADPDDPLDDNGARVANTMWEIYIALGINGKYKGLH